MRLVLALAARTVRHRPGGWLLLALGTALALAIPIAASGAGTTVAAQTLRRAFASLKPADRAITVTQQRATGQPAPDALVESQLRRVSSAPVRRQVVFRELTLQSSEFFLAGADRVGAGVRVVSGRLPQSCTPQRCEVVQLGGDAGLTAAAATIGVVVVGRAERTDPLLVSGPFDTGGVPLLVAGDVDGLARLSALQLFGRTYAWVVALDADKVLASGVPDYVRLSGDVADTITARVPSTSVFRPDTALQAEDARAGLSTRRFGLLGGSAAVLLLGFAVLAAVSLRPEHRLLVTVLRRRGAGRAQVGVLTAVQAAVTCLVGGLVGAALGAAITAGLAGTARIPVARTVGHALTTSALGCALLLVAAAAITVASLLWPQRAGRSLRQGLDIVAVACIAAAVLAADRGATGLQDGADPLVVALPVLLAVAGGLIASRLWPPAVRLVDRVVRATAPRAVAGRLGLLGALRRPLRPVTTVALLAAAVAAVVFAGGYRATLLGGAADEAAFAVPLDARLTTGSSLVQPVTTASALPADVTAYGVTRSAGIVRLSAGDAHSVPLVGVDPAALPHVARWSRTTGSDRSARQVAADVRVPDAVTAPTVAAGARRLSIATTSAVPNTQATLSLAGPSGVERAVTLQPDAGTLAGDLPDVGGPARVIGIALREDPDYATHHEHNVGEGTTDQPVVSGALGLSEVRVDGTPMAWDWSTWTSALAAVQATPQRLDATYQLLGAPVVLAPGPAAPPPTPVVTDPATASAVGPDGQLLIVVGTVTVPAHVVAIMPRLPTVTGSFVLLDRGALSRLLDRQQPGTGAVGELWLASARPDLGAVLARPPFSALSVQLRADTEQATVSDPVSRGSRLLLALAAGLALLVAAAAVVLLVLGERRDAAGELYAWESDGVRPAVLRRALLVRAVSVVAVGVPAGLVTGVVLTRVGATLIAVDAAGTAPQPPLQSSIGVAWTAAVLAGALAAAIALAWLVAARSLREPLPVRPEVDLR